MTEDERKDRAELDEERTEDLELDAESADAVRGGDPIQDVTINKSKTATKAAEANDAYIRG